MAENTMPRLFISHHSSKSDVAAHIDNALAKRGVQCWLAPRDVEPGEPFDEAIRVALESCDAILLLFCESSDKSRHVKRELILADSAQKPIIPIRLEDIAPDNLGYFLADSQWIDWIEGRDDVLDRVASQAHRHANLPEPVFAVSLNSEAKNVNDGVGDGEAQPSFFKRLGLSKLIDNPKLRNVRSRFQPFVVLAAAFILALASWQIPGSGAVERLLYDVRAAYYAESVETDDRIVLILYDEQTAFDTGQRSPLDRLVIADAIRAVNNMNPRAIGIDVFFDQPTDDEDDGYLISALRSVTAPTYILTLPDSESGDEILGPRSDFLRSFVGSIDNSNVQLANGSLPFDRTGARLWPSLTPEGLPPLALALASNSRWYEDYPREIAYRSSADDNGAVFLQFSIGVFSDPEAATLLAPFIEDRYVIVGADLVDVDRHVTPLRFIRDGGTTAGAEIQAHMLAQALDGKSYSPLSLSTHIIMAMIAIGFGAASRFFFARRLAIVSLVAAALLFNLWAFYLQSLEVGTFGLPVFGNIAAMAIAFFLLPAGTWKFLVPSSQSRR